MQPESPITPPRPTRHVYWGLLFLFSVCLPLPGINYMYMGLIKRGLAVMSGFFLLIFLMAMSSSGPVITLAAFAMTMLVITAIFDGFNIRRRINSGEVVEDGVGNLVNSILENKILTTVIVVIILLLIASSVIGAVLNILRVLIPIAVIAFGILVVCRARKKNKS